MTYRERIGAYARVVERVLDEVAARFGEPSDGPRMVLWAAKRWAAGDDASFHEAQALWARAFGDGPSFSEKSPFGYVRGAALVVGGALLGTPAALTPVAPALIFALEHLGERPLAARSRVAGELARELAPLDARAAA